MMSRDQTWLFFTLGRCLETTDVVARQLATVEFDQVFDSGLVMLLRSCGGYEPYLRLSQGVVEPGRVLDFLLRDRLFPRSAYASLTLAEECLDKINSGPPRHVGGRPGPGRPGPGRARVLLAGLALAWARDPARAPAGVHLVGLRRRDPPLLRPGSADTVAARGWGRVTRADGWRLHVSHETRFDYNAPARASYNELRLTPRTERRQTALETKIATVPPAPQYSYVDYWGTQVVAFNVDRGHEMLSITGTALIDTQRPEAPEDASWAEVDDASLTMADYLSHKLFTAPGPELAELATEPARRHPVADGAATSWSAPTNRCATCAA